MALVAVTLHGAVPRPQSARCQLSRETASWESHALSSSLRRSWTTRVISTLATKCSVLGVNTNLVDRRLQVQFSLSEMVEQCYL